MPERLRVALLVAAVLAAACVSRSPVGTQYVGPEYRELEPCALYADELSAGTRWLLQLTEVDEVFARDPEAGTRRFYEVCRAEPTRMGAFALAELAYMTGKGSGDPDDFLLSALAALAYLEGDPATWGPHVGRYKVEFRWACDLYNRAVGRAFPGDGDGTFELREGVRELPIGRIDVRVDPSGFPFPRTGLELLLASEYRTRGLAFRLRDSGLGAPLIAVVRRELDGSGKDIDDIDRTTVSATAFLRPAGSLLQPEEGLTATLELHSTYDAKSVLVGDRHVPLEADQSATVAYGTELAGYWRNDLRGLLRGQNAARRNGLVLPRPFERGRIPVVLVHGTASSPTYWAELLNTLAADKEIRSRFQFWLFLYDTGNPIAYSASTLREELTAFVESKDPDGEDPALRRMVLVGHSQGGLLVRMMGVTIDVDAAVLRAFDRPLEELGLDEEQEALIRHVFDVRPLPFAESLVFIATPHQGSFLADSWFARTLSKMIALPSEVVSLSEEIVRRTRDPDLPADVEPRIHTSLDNMDPDSSFLRTLQEAPLDPALDLHSIIAIGDFPDPEGAHDGVVTYESAHLDVADSETLIPTQHSCQSHPRTLMAMRRLLRRHIGLDSTVPGEDPR